MKKIIAALAVVFVAFSAVATVGAQAKIADGFYFAEDTAFSSSGWKDQVVLEVKGGKIVAVTWNGISAQGLKDKKSVAATGAYGMIKASKIGKEWHDQASAVEKYLIATQDTAFAKFTADGKTDAISGASMTVKGFYDLVKKAIAAGPVAKGTYKKDGWFYAKAAAPDKSGYHATAIVTIVNGRIVSVSFNGIHKDGGDAKLVRAVKGTYKMGAAQGEWNVQIARYEAAIIKQQDPAKIAVKADGKTDAVSGVSITVGEFATVLAEALKPAK